MANTTSEDETSVALLWERLGSALPASSSALTERNRVARRSSRLQTRYPPTDAHMNSGRNAPAKTHATLSSAARATPAPTTARYDAASPRATKKPTDFQTVTAPSQTAPAT
jgi:hypothetical protein